MIAICERTSIEITLENATNYAVYALLRLFSIIDITDSSLKMPCVGFLSSTLYALCIETKINFVKQNKGKITLIIFPMGRVCLAMS